MKKNKSLSFQVSGKNYIIYEYLMQICIKFGFSMSGLIRCILRYIYIGGIFEINDFKYEPQPAEVDGCKILTTTIKHDEWSRIGPFLNKECIERGVSLSEILREDLKDWVSSNIFQYE